MFYSESIDKYSIQIDQKCYVVPYPVTADLKSILVYDRIGLRCARISESFDLAASFNEARCIDGN